MTLSDDFPDKLTAFLCHHFYLACMCVYYGNSYEIGPKTLCFSKCLFFSTFSRIVCYLKWFYLCPSVSIRQLSVSFLLNVVVTQKDKSQTIIDNRWLLGQFFPALHTKAHPNSVRLDNNYHQLTRLHQTWS